MFSGVGATYGKVCVNSEYVFTFLKQRETTRVCPAKFGDWAAGASNSRPG